MKQMRAKALTIFFNENLCSDNYKIDEYLHIIYYNSNCELIARIYTFYDEYLNISNVRSRITNYISSLPFVYENFALIKDIKGENSYISNILSSPPSFSYNNSLLDIIYFEKLQVNLPSNQTPKGCIYSIEPKLPKGLSIDKYTGIIKGEPQVLSDKKEYEVVCENVVGKQTTKITLSIRLVNFQSEYCSNMINIAKENYTITKIDDSTTVAHCYINTVMNSGEEYHFTFMINRFNSDGEIRIGGTKTENYSEDNLYNQGNTHTIGFKTNSIARYGSGSNNSYTTSLVAGDTLEVIFDLRNRYMHYVINGKQCSNVFTSMSYPLYPFVELTSQDDSVTLLSVIKK